MTTQKTTLAIFGPNLNDQSRGSFHVHAAGCADCRHYGQFRKHGGEVLGEYDFASRVQVAAFIYADLVSEDEPAESFLYDIHFAPCVRF